MGNIHVILPIIFNGGDHNGDFISLVNYFDNHSLYVVSLVRLKFTIYGLLQ